MIRNNDNKISQAISAKKACIFFNEGVSYSYENNYHNLLRFLWTDKIDVERNLVI